MPKVTVKGFLAIKEAMDGLAQVEMQPQPPSLSRLLAQLAERFGPSMTEEIYLPGGQQARPHLQVLINGIHYRNLPGGLEHELQDGDLVVIFPPITGG